MLQTHLARYRLAEPLVQGAMVLDAGCGCGYGTHHLVTNGAKGAVGIDLSPEAIDYARQHYVAPGLSYQVMDVTSLEFPDETFDAAVCLEVFEHVPDHQGMLREVWRVLKPDGHIVISTPNGRVFSPKGRPINPWHVREFSREEFVDALSPHFRDLEIWGQTVKAPGTLLATLLHLRMQRYITEHDSRSSRIIESVYGWTLKAAMASSRWALGAMKEDPNVIRHADGIPDQRTWYFIATGRKKNER
jgi:SAM-dependent methyltransferase